MKAFRGRPGFRVGKGFTLLEIILAVGIGVIFMGGAVVLLSTTFEDPELRDTSNLLRDAARSAREKALVSGARQIVRLESYPGGGQGVNGQRIPEGVRMEIWRPGYRQEEWRQAGDPLLGPVEWEFTGGGLVEPIRLKLIDGEDVEILAFHALTGEGRREMPSSP